MHNTTEHTYFPKSWIDAFIMICCAHLAGVALCGGALAGSRGNPEGLKISALLFGLGIVSCLFAFLSVRFARSCDDESAIAKHLLIACLLSLSSAVGFFFASATAMMALV